MAVRVQVPRRSRIARFFFTSWGRYVLALAVALVTIGLVSFTYLYIKYARLIEAKLSAGPFAKTSKVFASPEVVRVGEEITAAEIVAELKRRSYAETRSNPMGWYHVRADAVEIFPGPQSIFQQEPGVIKFQKGKVSQIISLRDNTERTEYPIEPELITNLFDRNREKRRLVHFADIPKVLVNAVVSVEDKRFFQHSGFDPLRIAKAAYVDVRKGYLAEGASTLSMQLARMFWLTPEKDWKRKGIETLITLHLERKLSKEEIFEYYANQVDIGRRGSFGIHGFGEGSQAYFGKDMRQLTLPEAATLAGMIQRPSFTNPIRWPERARARRNVVLSLMRENGYIDDRQYAEAAAAPLNISRSGSESLDAPFFVDLVNDWLQDQFQQHDFQTGSYRVYTTLDLNLQREAAEAVRVALKEVDEPIARRFRHHKGAIPEAQVALVALDPYTGEIKALVGGRNYGMSQLNRALAKRPPGSVFKPFVYAAALNTALFDSPRVLTAVTTIMDEPTTFWFDNKPYEPNNHKNEFHGVVTLRNALAKSINIPTVKVAELVGYDTVVDLARRAGLNMEVLATPSVALGAYEVTPIEIAGAYTMYANHGIVSKPSWIKMIRDQNGAEIFQSKSEQKQVLDPRVAYLMVNLMEEVLRTGSGAGTRGRGFVLPAAGKTGTSRDGWFAGFTSKLLCVVWVGFDDGTDLKLEGARSALPIWTEFMKRAHQYPEYRGVKSFEAPDGIVSVEVDAATGQLATSACPNARAEVFISGSQPVEVCRLHGGGRTLVAGWEATTPPAGSAAGTAAPNVTARTFPVERPASQANPPPAAQAEKAKPKRGFWGRVRDIFK